MGTMSFELEALRERDGLLCCRFLISLKGLV
jgi:hypothetical protein